MQNVLNNRLNGLLANLCQQFQFSHCFITQLGMNAGYLDAHLKILAADFLPKNLSVQANDCLPLREPWLSYPLVKQLRNGCLSNSNLRCKLVLSQPRVEDFLND